MDDMDGAMRKPLAACIRDLCHGCQLLGNLGANELLQFGDVEDIRSRDLCTVCRLADAVIQNYRKNRAQQPGLGEDGSRETFSVMVHGPSPDSRLHGDGCICGRTFRLGTGSTNSYKPVAIIRQSTKASVGPGAFYKAGTVNASTLASWLHHCEAHHDQCRAQLPDLTSLLPRLLVIDVANMCLAEVPMPRYFALSYVWGPTKVFMTLESNFASLCEPGALERLGDQLPLLIRDAILLVQKLGERYLWVDSLCIIQDDAVSKQNLIGKMDLIYTNAVCTIMAHGSADASCPIPGVRPGTRQPIRLLTTTETENEPGNVLVQLMSSPPHYATCPLVYDTRGWTYQEQLLSRRRLILGADQAFFSCCSGAGELSEDPLACPGTASTLGESSAVRLLNRRGECVSVLFNLNPDAVGTTDLWRSRNAILGLGRPADCTAQNQSEASELIYTYTSAATHYSSRQLSFASDIMDAFAGIMASIERSHGLRSQSSIYGLLERYLHYNLHWTAKRPLQRPGSWPSWSWVAWQSQVHWLGRDNIKELQLEINDIYFLERDAVRKISALGSGSNEGSGSGEGAISSVVSISNDKDEQRLGKAIFPAANESSRQSTIIAKLLMSHHKSPLLAFWATVSGRGALHISPHPIRQTKIRIYAAPHYTGVCGHVYEEFDWSLPGRSTLMAAFGRLRLVYLSHSVRRCVFHMYDDTMSCRSCNVMVVDPGDEDDDEGEERRRQENGYLFAKRVAFAEVCGTYWDAADRGIEFIVLA